jgi:hypothetical protein
MPTPLPALLMSWQGKASADDIGSNSICSKAIGGEGSHVVVAGDVGQCFARTRRQNGSISQNATVRIPARSSPREKPPIPLKRSRTFTSAFHWKGCAVIVLS